MTLTYTTPTAPTFHTVTIPAPITPDLPSLPTSTLSVTEFTGADVNARLSAWAMEKYASATQALIDSEIIDILGWTGDEDTVNLKFAILKETILYDAQEKCKDVMKASASRGWSMLPGKQKRQILDIEIEAKKQLSLAAWKLMEEQLKISDEHLAFALEAGANKEKALFDHHHKVQMLTLETVNEISKNLWEVYKLNVEAFNTEVKEMEIALQNWQSERELRLQNHDAYIAQLESIATQEEKNVLDAELFELGIKIIDAENGVKLSTIKLSEIAANISKSNVQKYHAELQQYLANIEVISATYRAQRATLKGVIADKDSYLKRLENQRLEIKTHLQLIEEDQKRAKLDLATAESNLQMFKNSIEQFSGVLDLKKQEYDSVTSEYRNTVIQYTTSLNDALNTAVNEYSSAVKILVKWVDWQSKISTKETDDLMHDYAWETERQMALGMAQTKMASLQAQALLDSIATTNTELPKLEIKQTITEEAPA